MLSQQLICCHLIGSITLEWFPLTACSLAVQPKTHSHYRGIPVTVDQNPAAQHGMYLYKIPQMADGVFRTFSHNFCNIWYTISMKCEYGWHIYLSCKEIIFSDSFWVLNEVDSRQFKVANPCNSVCMWSYFITFNDTIFFNEMFCT